MIHIMCKNFPGYGGFHASQGGGKGWGGQVTVAHDEWGGTPQHSTQGLIHLHAHDVADAHSHLPSTGSSERPGMAGAIKFRKTTLAGYYP